MYLKINVNAREEGKIFISENGREFLPAEHQPLLHALEVGVLCNNGELPLSDDGRVLQVVGDHENSTAVF